MFAFSFLYVILDVFSEIISIKNYHELMKNKSVANKFDINYTQCYSYCNI